MFKSDGSLRAPGTVRCDGATRSGSRCSNCIAFNFDCTLVLSLSSPCYLLTAPVVMSKPPRSAGPLKGIPLFLPSPSSLISILFISYVESLENRLEKMERLLQRVSEHLTLVSSQLDPTFSFAPVPTLPKVSVNILPANSGKLSAAASGPLPNPNPNPPPKPPQISFRAPEEQLHPLPTRQKRMISSAQTKSPTSSTACKNSPSPPLSAASMARVLG